MISLTRLDGSPIGLNHRQIERIDVGPNTVVWMMNGAHYIVSEGFEEIVDRIIAFEGRVHSARLRSRALSGRTPLKLAAGLKEDEED